MAKQTVTFKGKPLQLSAEPPKVGDKMPDCTITNGDLQKVKLSKWLGKPFLILSVPSLDTSVCSTETLRFSQELAKKHPQFSALVVSMDLPFAQKRWCIAEKVKNIEAFSDFQAREFGEKWGLRIEELGLLARAVFIIDEKGTIRFAHLVKEVTDEPPYDEVLNAIAKSTPVSK